MANKQQTAVEWLFSQLPDHLRLSRSGFDMKQIANNMFREQIINAHDGFPIEARNCQNGEEYYKLVYSLPDGQPE